MKRDNQSQHHRRRPGKLNGRPRSVTGRRSLVLPAHSRLWVPASRARRTPRLPLLEQQGGARRHTACLQVGTRTAVVDSRIVGRLCDAYLGSLRGESCRFRGGWFPVKQRHSTPRLRSRMWPSGGSTSLADQSSTAAPRNLRSLERLCRCQSGRFGFGFAPRQHGLSDVDLPHFPKSMDRLRAPPEEDLTALSSA
jgi:hypothetical protein